MNRKYKDLSDYELIKMSKNGSEGTFEVLIERYKDKIHQDICTLVGNKFDANDIIQETFIKAYIKLDTYTKDSSFYGWLRTIARNIFIDLIRKKNNQANIEISDYNECNIDYIDEDNWQHKEDKITSIEQLISYLPNEYREVLNLRFFLDMSYKDISKKLNVPIGTIKTWVHRAKNELKKNYNIE